MKAIVRPLRTYERELFLYVGVMLIIVSFTGLTVSYLGWSDAKQRQLTIVTSLGRSSAGKITVRPTAASPAPRGKTVVQPVAKTVVVKPYVPMTYASGWYRPMAYSAGALLVGFAFVRISFHVTRPKDIRSGADEMLHEPLPF